MSAQTVIDSLEFARAEQEVQGSVPVSSLTRLQDCLYDADGDINYKLKGGRDDEMRPILALEISGFLHVRCQRCLGPLQYELRSATKLRLSPDDENRDTTVIDPKSLDCIEASAALDVVALVEDEVLLGLPLSPRHAEQTCATRMAEAAPGAERPNPFAKLAELKKVVDNRN